MNQNLCRTLLSLLFALSLAASFANAQQSFGLQMPPCSKANGSLGLRWIVNAGSLHHAEPVIPPDLQQRNFGTPCTFMIGKGSQPPYSDWQSVGTISVKSMAEVSRCCEQGVNAVLYDPESWEFTPVDEQLHPADYACRIAEKVHALHRIFIAAPATDVIAKWTELNHHPGDRYDHFLESGIAAGMARCSDVFEVQAQGAEDDPKRFYAYVEAIQRQVRAQNPHIVLLAGVSTNPNGRNVTADQVLRACTPCCRSSMVSGSTSPRVVPHVQDAGRHSLKLQPMYSHVSPVWPNLRRTDCARSLQTISASSPWKQLERLSLSRLLRRA
jgi:hypothetical protein